MKSIFVSAKKISNKLHNKHGIKIKSKPKVPVLTLLHFIWKGVPASLPPYLPIQKNYIALLHGKRLGCRNPSRHIFCSCINLTAVIHSKFVLLLQVQNSEISARQQPTQVQWPNNIYQAAFQNSIQYYSSNFTFFKCNKTPILL